MLARLFSFAEAFLFAPAKRKAGDKGSPPTPARASGQKFNLKKTI